MAILALIYSRIPVEKKKLTELQIENFHLDNEIKKEELKQLREKG